MDTQTTCTYNPGTRTCSAKATGMDVRSRPEHCEMLTPPALMSESGVWGQLERKRDELEVEAVQDVQAIQAAQAVTTKQAPAPPANTTPSPTARPANTPAPPANTTPSPPAPPANTTPSPVAPTAAPTTPPVAGMACEAYTVCGQCNDDALTEKVCVWCDVPNSENVHSIGQCVSVGASCPDSLVDINECPAVENDPANSELPDPSEQVDQPDHPLPTSTESNNNNNNNNNDNSNNNNDGNDNNGQGIVGGSTTVTGGGEIDSKDEEGGMSAATLALAVGGGAVCLAVLALAVVMAMRKRRVRGASEGGSRSSPSPHYGGTTELRAAAPSPAIGVYEGASNISASSEYHSLNHNGLNNAYDTLSVSSPEHAYQGANNAEQW